MGDYLSDLITKNTGTADVLRPRRPARFEPLHPANLLGAEIDPVLQTEIVEQEEVTTTTRPRRPRARAIEETEERPPRKDSNEPLKQSPPPLVSSAEFQTPVPHHKSAAATFSPKSVEAARETAAEKRSVFDLLTPPLVPVVPLPAKDAEKREKSDDSDAPAVIRADHEPPKEAILKTPPPNAAREIIEKHDRIVIEPRVEKIENRVTESTTLQPVVSPPPAQVPKQLSERAEIAETPTINVTIGRVEIRAAVSSVPPKEIPANRPALSLNEYLRNRGNGGRK